jgi:hypothetical protein
MAGHVHNKERVRNSRGLGWLADNETYDIQNPDDGDGVGVRNV